MAKNVPPIIVGGAGVNSRVGSIFMTLRLFEFAHICVQIISLHKPYAFDSIGKYF